MNSKEARKIVREFDERKTVTEEDVFLFTEAMEYLIRTEKNPKDMLYLGGYYYEIREFDLALKYYEMAAAMDYDPAYECLGYIWYYGRTGTRDYEKAFRYFSRLMEKGDMVAAYKVADMYKNGYYVEKSQEKYEEIIEKLYERAKKCDNAFDPVPEIYTRLARIRKKQGKMDEAAGLYMTARRFLKVRIKYNPFWGNLNIMKWLIDDLYEIIAFDQEYIEDLYDLYYLLKSPHRITFCCDMDGDTIKYEVVSVMEEGECAVCFEGTWYRSRDEFFKNAEIGDTKLTSIHDDIYGFEVTQ